MTPELLLQCMPFAGGKAQAFADPLGAAMLEFHIDTPKRQAAFLSQIAHESGSLKYVQEIADGSAYEGRHDLGNVQSGDGKAFKGRGLIQITGRSNYVECGAALGADFVGTPSLLETPENSCRSAAWFWHSRNLNHLADGDKFGAITKRINGGFNGIDDRLAHWLRIRSVLKL